MIVEIIQKGVSNNMSVETLTQLTGLTEKDKITMDDVFLHVASLTPSRMKAATIKRLYHEFKKVGQP